MELLRWNSCRINPKKHRNKTLEASVEGSLVIRVENKCRNETSRVSGQLARSLYLQPRTRRYRGRSDANARLPPRAPWARQQSSSSLCQQQR